MVMGNVRAIVVIFNIDGRTTIATCSRNEADEFLVIHSLTTGVADDVITRFST